MTQKVLKVGDSAAVVIPKDILRESGLSVGDLVIVHTKKRGGVSVDPVDKNKLSPEDEKVLKLALDFIERYRSDLEALAKK